MFLCLFGRLRTACVLRMQHARLYEKDSRQSEAKVVLTENGSTIVCWHPEEQFPYEYSLPLPMTQNETDSVLKMGNKVTIMAHFKSKNPEVVREELMKITHTTKHRWFPRPRDKYKREYPPDREFL